jgi:hypothetical protein
MELFYGGGGRSNPDFRFKIRIHRHTGGDLSGMMEWCDNYPVTGAGYFQRYYIDWRDPKGDFDGVYATFQFEQEEPAIMFALKFGAS